MSYLFFDIEAANRHDKTAKIYSFGYVLTDKHFNIIEQREIIINPDAEYYFRKDGVHQKIPCPIDAELMAKAELFPHHYDEIKRLVSSNVCIGYDTANDAFMLHESCKRYDLASYDFRFYDLREISDTLLGKRISGLSKLAEHLDYINENPHNGLSDAVTTFEVCKKLLSETKYALDYLRFKSKIFMYHARNYKVYKMENGKERYVNKRIFDDMRIKDDPKQNGNLHQTFKNDGIHNNQLGEELKKWLKEAEYQDTHIRNNN
ncbi:3'-5' exonuclease [Candidatus Xianfuyuplasma coldseepsis]|uniref:3'-5' exonuclease n=1 Tax=Candidatus Xianfuyuplasma coldseepsis TaxID=2782163 RepID=A0A7L7KTI5_9MOLU|nr:3'-5' exonuclease [Xianfuyuplasma coldseepsis]QMS85274.1 3'-5' exonuclease [Xianfuyuplasma coldseepsis]